MTSTVKRIGRAARVAAAATLCILAAAACASSRAASSARPDPMYNTVFEIENGIPDPLNIYVVTEDGPAIRLGRITSLSKRTFTLPAGLLVRQAQLQATKDLGNTRMHGFIQPTAAANLPATTTVYVTFPFNAIAGDRIRWVIRAGGGFSPVSTTR